MRVGQCRGHQASSVQDERAVGRRTRAAADRGDDTVSAVVLFPRYEVE